MIMNHARRSALKCTTTNSLKNSLINTCTIISHRRHSHQTLAPKQTTTTTTTTNTTNNEQKQFISPSSGSTFSEHAQRLEETVLQRYAAKRFNPNRPIPPQVLSHILALAQRAPTGYNLQPWTAIVVTDPKKKQELFEASLRQQKILDAPVTVIIAANHGQPLQNLETVLEQGRSSSTMTEEQIDRVRRLSNGLLNTGPACALQVAKYIFTTAISLFYRPMVVPPINMKAYVWKQTVMAADVLMLAASAHGVQSCPMEGFDERRVRNVVGLPGNYSVPLIVSLGYSSEHLDGRKRTPRIDPETQYFNNLFGEKMEHLMSMNEEFSDFLQEFRGKYGDLSSSTTAATGSEDQGSSGEEATLNLPVVEPPKELPTSEEEHPKLST